MKTIILDCDDVLLDFMPGFAAKARAAGLDPDPAGPGSFDLSGWLGLNKEQTADLIRSYIEDEDSLFGDMPAIEGAVEGVLALKDAGYDLMILSSFSNKKRPFDRRMKNLEARFGYGVFDDMMGLDLGSSKLEALKRMTPSIYIDDLLKNAEDGLRAGHDALWMRAHHNIHDFYTTEIPVGMKRAANWTEILQITLRHEHVVLSSPQI